MNSVVTASPLISPQSTPSVAGLIFSLFIVGLGTLVDVYDVWLFTVVRQPSLVSIGVPASALTSTGIMLLNLQVVGMVVGGIFWGLVGDARGRKSVLFGSILLYSAANLLNGLICDVPAYAFLRFLAGVGLAGEVGAAMTTAAEITPLPYRGFGTAAVATMGFLGSILASFCGGILPWRIAFITAGLAGLLLLFGRMKVAETGLFLELDSAGESSVARLLLLFREGRALRLGRCILCGVPFWFGAGLLVSCAPAICKGGMVSVATVALVYTIGQALGNIVCGFLSQILRSRKKAILIFLFAAMISTGLLLLCGNTTYVYLSGLTGFCMGSFAMLLTTTAEQFGTNLRSTVSSIVPNAVRASVMPITFSFMTLDSLIGSTCGALLTGLCCFLLAILAAATMDETFGRDLSYVE